MNSSASVSLQRQILFSSMHAAETCRVVVICSKREMAIARLLYSAFRCIRLYALCDAKEQLNDEDTRVTHTLFVHGATRLFYGFSATLFKD